MVANSSRDKVAFPILQGSNRTFCFPVLKIGVKEISLQVIGCSDKSSKCSSVHLPRVYVTENFPCMEHSVASYYDIQKWSYLSDVDLGALDTGQVFLVIGQDVLSALLPQ